MSANIKAIIILVVFILVSVVGLNYFGALPLSQKLPFLSFLPTQSGLSSCIVVEEKYCSQAELLEKNTTGEITIKFIGIKLPTGTSIFSPSASQVGKAKLEKETFKGNEISVGGNLSKDASIPAFFFRGDLQLDKTPTDVAKNGVLGYVGDTGINNFGYNLVILIGPASENAQNVEKFLKPMFPKAFEKPAKKIGP
ncbi:MAG: hypothetical protein HY426_03285 [Candidatus Levybacteria bacterium]|nr:hypothetical protein [Candidatus Levybacteria bacterium]